MDGDAPELKKETLEARRKAETQSQNVEVKSLNRTRLKGLMNESKKLLEAIGVLVVKSKGEAEKMCAQLNANNVVSAVISGCTNKLSIFSFYKKFTFDPLFQMIRTVFVMVPLHYYEISVFRRQAMELQLKDIP